LGFDAIISILKLRGSAYSFTQQKVRQLTAKNANISSVV